MKRVLWQNIRGTAEIRTLNKQRVEKSERFLFPGTRLENRMKCNTAHMGTEQEPGGSKMKMIEPSKSFTFMGHIIFYLASRILRSQNSEINQNHCLKVAQPPHSIQSCCHHCLLCPCTLMKTLVARPTWVVPRGCCPCWCIKSRLLDSCCII